MSVCILDNIEKQIEALITNMSIDDGFNYNWSIINEEDEAIGDFPRAIIDPRDSFSDKESSRDTLAGIGSNDYTNEVMFTILVTGSLVNFSENPSFAIRSNLRRALDDLKQLFGIHNQLQGTCDNIMYVGSQQEPVRKNDVMSAANLRTVWKVIYSQDRIIPSQYASS